MPLVNFSGIASGIDSEGLISAILDAERARRVLPNQKKIAEIEDTNDVLSQFRSKLTSLKDTLYKMSSVFNGALQKIAQSSDETIYTATANSAAYNASYTITVDQLARNGTFTLGASTPYSSSDAAIASGLGGTETVSIQIGTPAVQTVQIDVSSSTTLSQFVNEFNTETTRAVASIVNLGTSASPDYKIVITTNKTGEEEGYVNVTGLTNIQAAGGFNDNTNQQAQNAQFDIGGIGDNIVRQTNSISDVINGVTLNLKGSGASSATLTVSDDTSGTTSQVQSLVTAYNDVISFIRENNSVTRDESGAEVKTIFGPLALTSLDDNFISLFRSAISQSIYSSGSEIKVLADLGITTNSDPYNADTRSGGGTLNFDTTVLASAISKEPNSVNQILKNLGDLTGRTGGIIDNYVGANRLIDTTVNSNKEQISDLNDRIAVAEAAILKQQESLRQRFALLERSIGRLQNQQAALTSALASLPRASSR